ncbi:MAG: hypothetical protein ACRDF0_05240 [Candidatus Limnocylindria bacterium]
MSGLGAPVIIVLFVGGIALGLFAQSVVSPGAPANPYRSLPLEGEPAAASAVASTILADDARRLAQQLDGQALQALDQAMRPLVDIFEMRFVGAVERRGDTLAGYVAEGRDLGGQTAAVGIVLRVRDGRVIGVN